MLGNGLPLRSTRSGVVPVPRVRPPIGDWIESVSPRSLEKEWKIWNVMFR
jgi:hypothetical protein